MEEVIMRRYSRVLEDNLEMPQLIIMNTIKQKTLYNKIE
jgi:excinuclease UvrABC nuclease subunit